MSRRRGEGGDRHVTPCPVRAGRWPSPHIQFFGSPDGQLRVAAVDGHRGQDDSPRSSSTPCCGPRATPPGSWAPWSMRFAGEEIPARSRPAVRGLSPRILADMVSAGVDAVGDGGHLAARSLAAAPRGSCRRGGRVHQHEPRPAPRLPHRHGGLLPARQAPASSRDFGVGDRSAFNLEDP